MDKRKVIYYTDELNDEFSVAKITAKTIDGNYRYVHNSLFKKFTHFFWYRLVATPIAYLYTKAVFHHKIIGKEVLKEYKHTGYFVYGNHTQDIADAFIPNMLNFPKHNYVIVHPNNVSMPYLGRITPSLGALPLPDDRAAYKNFINAIETRISQGHAIVIYPEAHIWPYYTKIRPFGDVSFSYPIKLETPVFCFTNTYQKRRFSKKPRIVTYIDGPFFADKSLSAKDSKRDLRDKVYNQMCKRALNCTVVQIQYIKKVDENG
ncbi:MAG: hypothetical protein IJ424_06235 [Oscillospiraceae bacterium]|nr:hypothetical protein [Oscillospiraceae bacterium]